MIFVFWPFKHLILLLTVVSWDTGRVLWLQVVVVVLHVVPLSLHTHPHPHTTHWPCRTNTNTHTKPSLAFLSSGFKSEVNNNSYSHLCLVCILQCHITTFRFI